MLDRARSKPWFALPGRQLLGAFDSRIGHRWRQLRWITGREGLSGLADRARTRVAALVRPTARRWPVRVEDVLAADLDAPFVPSIPALRPGGLIMLNWVMTGPAAGSGGHTTIFRVLRHLEAHGYRNRVYFYDPRLTDPTPYVAIVRDYFGFAGPVARLDGPMEEAHGVIATSWPSAYAAYNARSPGRRFYFVQDFEPDFYPVGAERVLAENTYRMGFHAITAGRWLAEKLGSDYAMPADPFEFGCDTSKYRNRNEVRNGVAYYARPGAPRRGFEIGVLALELFAARHPEIDIHLYGEHIGTLPFRAIDHGLVSPAGLNDIYNRCFAGLSLSLTNVSLVPFEMLAAGCLPVVNEARHNRLVLDNPHVSYASPTPQALCAALDEIVALPDFAARSQAASASQRALHWDDAGIAVDIAIRRAIAAAQGGHDAER